MELTTKTKFFKGQRNCSLTERLVEKGRLGKKVGERLYLLQLHIRFEKDDI